MNVVEITDISLKIKSNIILQNVNLSIQAGEFVYLTGKVGSGKSSLLKLLYKDLVVDSGSIKVAEFDLNNISKKELPFLRRKLGIVFQEYQLLNDRNVFENLKFVLEASGIVAKKQIKGRIENVLNHVQLVGKEMLMPYDLSGGEQQQAMIARALINEPELIIADEPTANLDAESSKKIMQILFDITKKGTAVIMATHDESHIKNFPAKVYNINDGKILSLLT